MQTVRVAAGIIWRDSRFLAAKRPEGKPRAGYWEFPGGKQEPGEHIRQTLVRELREELGIACATVLHWQTLSRDYPDLRVVLHFMHVVEFSGDPLPKDGQELRWVTPEEACKLPFLPADKAVINALHYPLRGLNDF